MGATNCPETPRQKMIGMMYLVLTAMLALNVSKEIINAFVTVGDAMQQTNQNFQGKIMDTYTTFTQANQGSPEKVGENYTKAMQVQAMSIRLTDFIDNTLYDYIAKVEGKVTLKGASSSQIATRDLVKQMIVNEGVNSIVKKDEYSEGTRFFCGEAEDGVGAKATEIKDSIENFKKQLKLIVGADSTKLKLGLDFSGPFYEPGNPNKSLTWERYNFYNTITVANVVILKRLKAEVMNAEYDVINFLYNAVSSKDLKFSSVNPKIIPTSKYVLEGSNYEAIAIAAAYDSKAELTADINGQTYKSKGGEIAISFLARGLGEKTLAGKMYVQSNDGMKSYSFTETYTVIPPTAVVSLTNMDVFYVGLENPVSISVPMVDGKSVSVEFANNGVKGTVVPDPEKKGAGNYLIKVPNKGKAFLNIYATLNGKRQLVGTKEYRCKDIPKPTLVFGNLEGGGAITKEQLLAAGGFRPTILDFEFKVPPLKAASYMMETVSAKNEYQPFPGTGNRFTPEMLEMIKGAKAGKRISIIDVRVVTPDGKQHNLSANLIIKN